ncbi:MAG: hypothetical protein U1E60_10750 [Reyranellaceae bacterium]
MHIDRVPLWLPVLVVLASAALWYAWRRGWLRLPLSERELVVVSKILFVAGAIMVLVMLRNSIELPAGQFIYGRF